MAVEYFTKWVEEEPLIAICAANIIKFFWKNLFCHFGVPCELTIDNGKQFDSRRLRARCLHTYCEEIGTKICFTSVYHP